MGNVPKDYLINYTESLLKLISKIILQLKYEFIQED